MNKIIFITGATSGFGKAIAELFAKNGYDCIVTGRRKERLDLLQKDLEMKYNVAVYPLCFDVRKKEQVDKAIESIQNICSHIDILVNNAGLAAGRDYFDEAQMDDWETMIDTNIKGVLYVTKALLPFMKINQKGHIINIGSTAAKEVYEKGNVYCATKAAVDALSASMRIDLLRFGIKVTAIHPGAAETEFSMVRLKGDEAQAKAVYQGFQPLIAEDIANVVYFTTTLPDHVCINDLVMTSTAQANSFYFNRKQ